MILAISNFLKIATGWQIIRRALTIALIVGTILALINYGDKFLMEGLTKTDLAKIFLTFLVPYGVSTISSVLAHLEWEKKAEIPD